MNWLGLAGALGLGWLALAADETGAWPQHQHDAARTGRSPTAVAPPYRARWIWLGPERTLRNQASQPGWPDDLRARNGHTYAGLPNTSPFTLSDGVQPVVSGGRVYVGSMEGRAFALDALDGATVWTQELPAGIVSTAAVVGDTVVFSAVTGEVTGLDAGTGQQRWQFDTGRAITSAPCLVDDCVLVANHGGEVLALGVTDGRLRWRSPRLPAPIHGGLAADADSVYVGAENLVVYAMRLADGTVRAAHAVRGQSFRMLWPVVFQGRVWVSTVTTPIIGSEYIGEANAGSSLLADGTSLAAEEANWLRWLAGDTHGGRWPEASPDWRHLFVLDAASLSEPFLVPAGPVDGVGVAAHPVVVDPSDRVLTYFKTAFPRLNAANGAVFGTKYSVDIAAVDPQTGRRVPIDHGHLANVWPWETDNLYGLSVAGTQLWMRQNFRGTLMLDLANGRYRGVSAPIRHHDGGNFSFDVVYRDQGPPIRTPQAPLLGRTAPAIAGGRVYLAENWAVTCIESAP